MGFGGASGYLQRNVYKPLMIFNITHAIDHERIMTSRLKDAAPQLRFVTS